MWLMGLHISLRRYSFLLLLCSLCSSDYISTNMSSSSQILLSFQIYYWVPLVKFSCQFQNLHLVSFFSSFYLFVFWGFFFFDVLFNETLLSYLSLLLYAWFSLTFKGNYVIIKDSIKCIVSFLVNLFKKQLQKRICNKVWVHVIM